MARQRESGKGVTTSNRLAIVNKVEDLTNLNPWRLDISISGSIKKNDIPITLTFNLLPTYKATTNGKGIHEFGFSYFF